MSLLGLSFLQADDIDLYLQGVSAAGDETFDGGNQSAMTFLLDSSGSMSFAIDSDESVAVSYATGGAFYNEGERRIIMKNAFIDYVSSAPSDLKIGMYDYDGQRVTTDLLTRLYDDPSEVITYEGDDDADAPISFARQPSATGQFQCDDENNSIHCDTSDPDYRFDNDDRFNLLTRRFARAGYASFELPAGSAYEGNNIDRIYISDIRRQTGENIELIVKVYDDMTTSDSNANGQEVFNVAAPSTREITRFEVNLGESIYEFDAAALSDIADDLSDGNYSDLQFIIVPKNPRSGSSSAEIDLDSDDLRLNIEYTEDDDEEAEADGVVTSTVMTIGSDVLEDNSGDVFDLNRTDVSGGQDMKALSLSGNSKVAFRFMLLPFDSSNTGFIDDIRFRVYPSGTIGSDVTVSIGLTSDSEVIPVEPGALTVLYDSATKADVTIDSGGWNSAASSGDGYQISLPDTLKNAIISRMSSSTGWDYQDAITLVLDRVSGTSDIGFYSYEQSHEPSDSCPQGSESYVLSSYAGNQTFCDYGTTAKLEFSLYNSASVYNLMKRSHREQVILSAMTFGSSGGTPISPRYIDIAEYYQGGSSPLEDTGSKECGIPDAIVMLTDGQETSGSDPRSSFYSYFPNNSPADFGSCSRSSTSGSSYQYWDCSNKLAQGLKSQGVVVDNQDYQIRSYGILFGPAQETPETHRSYPDTAYDYLTEFARAAETTNENDKAYAAQSGYELVKVFKAIEGSVTFQSVS
ncbi:MAG: hypothetical protein SVC26_04340, partial [Pseudomonadota bacterium]|nr:hypothetical protein [Pseudomonadota bacterium]